MILTENLAADVEGRASLCFQSLKDSAIYTEDTSSLNSITNFFHDDPNVPYTRPPERTLEQSPCYPIIAVRHGYFYRRLHPDVKYVYLESIEHHIKYKDPEAHKSELLKLSKLTHN